MIQLLPRSLTFETFLEVEDSHELNEYELVEGQLTLMPEPDDWHEEILEFLAFMFVRVASPGEKLQYRRQKLPYSVRKRNALMINAGRGRRPDIAVIDRPATRREERQAGIRTTPRLIVEIASGNWSTDLVDKQEEYEALQVPEYWIIDYRGQIPAKYCQRDKGPKVIGLILVEGVYQRTEYLPDEIVPCLTFPDLSLTVDQILAAEE